MTVRIAIVNTSIFDSWAAYDRNATGTLTNFKVDENFITEENKKKSISFSAYQTLTDLFPSEVNTFNSVMNKLGYDSSDRNLNSFDAAEIGNLTANKILDFYHFDGSNQLNNYVDTSGYQPVNTWDKNNFPDRWQPLSSDNGTTIQKFLTPHWGDVTPFALNSGDKFLPPPPKPYLDANGKVNPEYIDQALETIKYSAELTDEQKVIVEYWSDGPSSVLPPGHWDLIAQYVSVKENLSTDDNVKLFFTLGNALKDAGIAAWDAKTYYDYGRPLTSIRYLATNNLLPENSPYVRINPNTKETEIYSWTGSNYAWVSGSKWLPYQKLSFVTPPFAEYVSGHSTFSSAAAEVLKRYTGSDDFGACYDRPTHSSLFDPNVPANPVRLCWDTFTDAANQASMSRLYGGIHFSDGNLYGKQIGRSVGDVVWNKAQGYINGKTTPAKTPESSSIGGLFLLTASVFCRKQGRKYDLK